MKTDSLRQGQAAPPSTEEVRARRQRARNRAVLLSLLALIFLIYLISIVRMSGG
ncbi:MAG TPA: hypothetical protein VFE11_13430 [Dongiaceae bacterium]|jgi:hypothetical protein|nr:hypothetical protein [Dongiaceae bacterium]